MINPEHKPRLGAIGSDKRPRPNAYDRTGVPAQTIAWADKDLASSLSALVENRDRPANYHRRCDCHGRFPFSTDLASLSGILPAVKFRADAVAR
jgi:hypothetical protein